MGIVGMIMHGVSMEGDQHVERYVGLRRWPITIGIYIDRGSPALRRCAISIGGATMVMMDVLSIFAIYGEGDRGDNAWDIDGCGSM